MGAAGPVIAAIASDDALAWQEYAACAQTDPEAFFPEKGSSSRGAKQVCAGCFVREDCLAYALEHGERFGVWGGLSERQRRSMPGYRSPAPAVAAVASKWCSCCKTSKDASEFPRDGKRADGLDTNCKDCRAAARKARAAA